MKFVGLLLIVSLLVFGTAAVHAQEAPAAINDAVRALSQELGIPLTLDQIWQWRWVGEIFPDTSLGCPQPGQTYPQVLTNGFQFLLTYAGTTYDYRVSADRQIVFLCRSFPAGTEPPALIAPAPAVPAPAVPVDPAVPQPVVPVGDSTCELLPPRLVPGEQGRVLLGLTRLNLRAEPALTSTVINQIPGGGIFTVIDGPECGPDGLPWWQVNYRDQVGWVAEGLRNVYYVEPLPEPVAVPTELTELEATDRVCGFLVSRLNAGEQARVLIDLGRLNVRTAPTLASQRITQLPGGSLVTLVSGPICAPETNILWWQIALDETVGWVAEGRGGVYFMEPLPEPLALNANDGPNAQ
jgi:uncharacterized protein YgiM (DUF1202 family)